jgi:predicted GNAT family acetyltransferase
MPDDANSPEPIVSAAEVAVVDDAAHGRFLLTLDGHEAELVYRLVGDRFVLAHTEVPDALGGQGVGGRLVRAAAERARHESLTIVPSCPFARGWLEKHPAELEGVAVDWDAGG